MQIGIAKEFIGLTDYDHVYAQDWCKACIQKRIDQDHLENRVDWNELIVDKIRIDEYGRYRIVCRLPLKDIKL